MTAASLWPVQAAIHARLAAHAPLLALLPRGTDAVTDYVEDDAPFPYIVLGDMQVRPFDTSASTGDDITLDIHAFSQGYGMKEVKALLAAIRASLHRADLAVDGFTVILCDLVSEESRLLADARTRQGTQRFRIITEPNS